MRMPFAPLWHARADGRGRSIDPAATVAFGPGIPRITGPSVAANRSIRRRDHGHAQAVIVFREAGVALVVVTADSGICRAMITVQASPSRLKPGLHVQSLPRTTALAGALTATQSLPSCRYPALQVQRSPRSVALAGTTVRRQVSLTRCHPRWQYQLLPRTYPFAGTTSAMQLSPSRANPARQRQPFPARNAFAGAITRAQVSSFCMAKPLAHLISLPWTYPLAGGISLSQVSPSWRKPGMQTHSLAVTMAFSGALINSQLPLSPRANPSRHRQPLPMMMALSGTLPAWAPPSVAAADPDPAVCATAMPADIRANTAKARMPASHLRCCTVMEGRWATGDITLIL